MAGQRDIRVTALRRFAAAITILNVLGHTVLGFEQSVAQPLVALAVAYVLEMLFEWIEARSEGRTPRFLGGKVAFFDFLLPPHISALACAMLLLPNDHFWPLIFAVTVAIGSKYLFRAPVGKGVRHFLNPSNTGITATLVAYHWISISPPYMFTENLVGWQDWILPCIIVASGSFLNAKLTKRVPLILAWVGTFALQAVGRAVLFDTPLLAGLTPMTGVAFLLFTFYMVTDPATTPSDPKRQVAFGASVALLYGVLMRFHVVFAIFFALTLVCMTRGLALKALAYWRAREAARAAVATHPSEGRDLRASAAARVAIGS
jgi:enediyne biosynthesis protein E5